MRTIKVCPLTASEDALVLERAVVRVSGREVEFAMLNLPDPSVDMTQTAMAEFVLVRTVAFSLNFRDRALMADPRLRHEVADGIGSEFAGEVAAAGRASGFKPGDRVMADMSYPESGSLQAGAGVATNAASREFALFHSAKLRHLPIAMTYVEAAAFVLTAQTAAGLIRRCAPVDGEHVLITAPSSNTSSAVIELLRHRNLDLTVVTRSSAPGGPYAPETTKIVHLDTPDAMADLASAMASLGGCDVMIDPFGDVYLPWAPLLLATGGRYVTCGRALQGNVGEIPHDNDRPDLRSIVGNMIVKNLSIMGNCLGSADDLSGVIDEWNAGRFRIRLDSQFGPGELRSFLVRSHAGDRRGKVVFCYA